MWPLDLWASALRRTRSTSWAIYHTKADCDLACKRPGWRAWAFDLGSKAGATNHPKRYVAAPLEIFTAAYQLVPPEHRHAYEIIEGPCHAFFDLECPGEHLAHGDEMAHLLACTALADTDRYRNWLRAAQPGYCGETTGGEESHDARSCAASSLPRVTRFR